MSVFPSEAKLLFHCIKVGDAIVGRFSATKFKITFAFSIMMVDKPSAALLAILGNAGVSGGLTPRFVGMLRISSIATVLFCRIHFPIVICAVSQEFPNDTTPLSSTSYIGEEIR